MTNTMKPNSVLLLSLALCVSSVSGAISTNCLSCICKIEGCESQINKCREDVGSLSCGPFQIKEPYWIDCGRPGGDWQTCTKQMACSQQCVRAYMARYAQRCTGGRTPTCQDYSRVHNGGPNGCNNPNTLGYWKRVSACCQSKPGGCGYLKNNNYILKYEWKNWFAEYFEMEKIKEMV